MFHTRVSARELEEVRSLVLGDLNSDICYPLPGTVQNVRGNEANLVHRHARESQLILLIYFICLDFGLS